MSDTKEHPYLVERYWGRAGISPECEFANDLLYAKTGIWDLVSHASIPRKDDGADGAWGYWISAVYRRAV